MLGGLANVSWKGWAALATFAVQNGVAVLVMRYSKLYGAQYSSQVAVLMQELAIKLPLCSVLYAVECGGVISAARSVVTDLRERYVEWAQLAVPALLYTVQNTMMYVGYANVEAAIGQITYQSKILWTALFSVLILGKKLSQNQWLALVILALGVIAVQGIDSKPSPSSQGAQHRMQHHRHGRKHREETSASERQMATQNPLLGVGALVLAAVCTGFASVYFEKMLKGASQPSLWLRNIQLALYSSVIAALGVALSGDEKIARHGWFYGMDHMTTWWSMIWQASGGILVAVTIKYAVSSHPATPQHLPTHAMPRPCRVCIGVPPNVRARPSPRPRQVRGQYLARLCAGARAHCRCCRLSLPVWLRDHTHLHARVCARHRRDLHLWGHGPDASRAVRVAVRGVRRLGRRTRRAKLHAG